MSIFLTPAPVKESEVHMKFFRFLLLGVAVLAAFVLPALADFDVDESAIISRDDLTEEYVLTDMQVRAVNPIQPSSATNIKNAVLSIVGDYDAVVVEYQYQNQNSQYYSYLREIQPDYAWLCSCALLLVFIFCLFRLGGALLCRK